MRIIRLVGIEIGLFSQKEGFHGHCEKSAALALKMTALPADKTFFNQLKAAATLEKVFAKQPSHPGAANYLIHGCSGMNPLD